MNFKLLLLILFSFILTIKGYFRLTNVKCIEFDKSFATIPLCELKIVRRGVTAFNLNVTLHKLPVTNVTINFELLKKSNGYRPFLYNITTDFCDTMRHRNRLSFVQVIINTMINDTNINHTCPYDHDIIARNLILKDEMFKLLPLPMGDYLANIRVAAYNHWKACVKIYFNVKEDFRRNF